jgi:hypothetical protein
MDISRTKSGISQGDNIGNRALLLCNVFGVDRNPILSSKPASICGTGETSRHIADESSL